MTPTSSSQSSCCTRAWDCLRSKSTVHGANVAFCWITGMGASFIPVQFLNGLIAGKLMFLGCYAAIRHPDSALMINRALPERTWKQIALGSIVCGISWGFGTLALQSNNSLEGVALSASKMGAAALLLLGIGFGFAATYFDRIQRNSHFIPLEQQG